MPDDFATAMSRARDLVRAGKPQEATRLIQATLGQQPPLDLTPDPVTAPRPISRTGPRIDPASVPDAETVAAEPARKRRPLGDVITGLTRSRPTLPQRQSKGGKVSPPSGASFDWRTVTTPQGSREYRLYIPSSLPSGPQGLVLMLHGCTQDPDDFAAGTGMNAHAERLGLIVAYPAQTRSHNAQSCWNWFRPADQRRDSGEPAILAALAQSLAAEYGIGPDRTFAAGFSAGGAMAAILGHAYPDAFAAVGIHSGLAAGAASDVVSAFAAMRGDAGQSSTKGTIRTITFHGSADSTVQPANSAQIMAATRDSQHTPVITKGTANGRAYTCSETRGPDGIPLTAQYDIAGAGHAWSGGSSQGSYADPLGPDASALMLDFFLTTTAKAT